MPDGDDRNAQRHGRSERKSGCVNSTQRRGQRKSGEARAGALIPPSDDRSTQHRRQSARKSGEARAGALIPPSDDRSAQHCAAGGESSDDRSSQRRGRTRLKSPKRRGSSESPPGSRRRPRSPVTPHRDLDKEDHSRQRFETPAAKQVSFTSPEGVDPLTPNKSLLAAAARNAKSIGTGQP